VAEFISRLKKDDLIAAAAHHRSPLKFFLGFIMIRRSVTIVTGWILEAYSLTVVFALFLY